MGGLVASVAAIAILLGIALLTGFLVVCLVRLAAADEVRFLPKWAWAVVVLCANPLGGVIYLLSQSLRRRAPEPS